MTLCDRLFSFWRACARTKTGKSTSRRDLANARVYTIFGAVNVAIFDFLPTAVFLLAPHVTSYVTGPSAILSVVIAAVAAILTGFSYLDLRCRLWKSTTSTQDAIYRTGSEVSSFAVAWSSTAKSVALTSALVRGCSQSLNYLMGQRLTVLSLTLFSWVPTPRSHVVDVLGFMVCMVVWALVALRLVLRPSRMILVGFSLAVVAVLGVLAGAAVMVFDGENWNGVEQFFPEGYSGVMSGAAIFYLSFTVFDRLSSCMEYTSPKSIQLHLRSSLLGVAILGLFLAGSSTMISSMSSRSNLTTEQPLSEAFETASGSSVWTKYLVCVATMLFLTPSIFVQFERSVETVEDLARDGLIGRTLVSEDGAQERSVIVCLVLGCLCALGCAVLSIVTLCELAAVGALVEHLVVVVTVLAIRFQDEDAGKDTEEDGGVGGKRDARKGDGVGWTLPAYTWIKEIGMQADSIEEEDGEVGNGEVGNGEIGNGEIGNGEVKLEECGKGEVRNGEDENGEDDEVEANEKDRGYTQLPENLREEFGEEVKGGEEQPKIEAINILHQSSSTSPSPSPSSSPSPSPSSSPSESQSSATGATEDSYSTIGDGSTSSGSVPSSTEIAEIHPISSEQSLIHPSKLIDMNSFDNEDSATETDIDAIVDEYLKSRKDFLHPNLTSLSNSPRLTQTTYRKARLSILLFVTSCLALAAILAHAHNRVTAGHPVWIVAMVISIAGLLAGVVWLKHQPEEGDDEGEDGEEKRLRVRNLSLLYVAAILVVCAMLVTQQDVTSAVFGIWSALGFATYVICGVRRNGRNPPPGGHLVDEATSLLTTTSSSVYREDKRRRHRKSFIFGGDLLNESPSPVP